MLKKKANMVTYCGVISYNKFTTMYLGRKYSTWILELLTFLDVSMIPFIVLIYNLHLAP